MEKTHIVCLDPGHGPGTVNASPDGAYREAEFTWDMYQRLRPLLEGQGIAVVATRTQDEKPSLTARCTVSNAAGADLFVSLHSNAQGGGGWGSARGFLVYTSAGPMDAPRNVAAGHIVERTRAAGVAIQGAGIAHQAEYTVLVKTQAPAVLIEYGFHTNQAEAILLATPAHRDTLALATAKGVCDFLGQTWQEPWAPVPPQGEDPSPWAAEAWQGAVAQGLFDGTAPQAPLTREQCALVLRRLALI